MRLWPRNPWVRHGFAIAVALFAMSLLLRYRVLGWPVFPYLPWVGSVIVALNVLFLLDRFLGISSGDGTIADVAHRLDVVARVGVVAVAYAAIFVAFNAEFDRSPAVIRHAEVVDVGGRTVTVGVPVVYSWARFRFRDAGDDRVHVLTLGPEEQRKFWRGESLFLGVRRGSLGVPWLYAVERDDEAYCRHALELAPGARGPWRDLVQFLFEHALVPEATAESRRYVEAHPDDEDFAYWAGENLNQRGLEFDALPLLAHAVDLRPVRYYLYRLAWTQTRTGDVAAAIVTLEGARRRYPDAWEFPFLVAYDYAKAGRAADARAALERVEALKPGVPGVTSALGDLRAGRTQSAARSR